MKQEIAELKICPKSSQSLETYLRRTVAHIPNQAMLLSLVESVTDTYPKPQVVTTKERYHLDKKFNIIIYGIKECQKGTSKRECLESDLNSVVSVLGTFRRKSQKDTFLVIQVQIP